MTPRASVAAVGAEDGIAGTVARLRAGFDSGRTRPIEWRLQQLGRFSEMVAENEEAMFGALKSDLGKSAFEGWAGETYLIAGELKHARKHLASWMRPKRVRTPLLAQPGVSKVYAEPLGVVLNIAPWNYPIQLALAPLIGAIAAGNSVVLKPSEVAPACSALLARLLPRYLDPECVAVIEGGVPETTRLLEQRFDHIFYTGNGTVGRIVMEAAARHLTPVTLELGGKSPHRRRGRGPRGGGAAHRMGEVLQRRADLHRAGLRLVPRVARGAADRADEEGPDRVLR